MVQKVVLLPGLDGTGALFGEFVKPLPRTVEGTIVSYPAGLELSYAELMPIIGAAAPITDPYVLLAESFSTPLAIQFAATRPPNLRGLILCAGFASSPATGLRRLAGRLFAPILFRLPLPGFAKSFWLVGPGAPPSLHHAIRAALSTVPPEVLSARLRAVLHCDVRHDLSKITVPILVLQAGSDRLVPASSAEEMLLIRPDATLKTIDGPHLLIQREPRMAAAAVMEFIDSLN